jgi:hypothetical protein
MQEGQFKRAFCIMADKEFIIPFKVIYSDITGSNNSALMLAQIEYWQAIKGNDWVAKSVTDWWNELRLSKKQVSRIKAELETLGYIETCLLFFKGSQTTGYFFKKDAVQKALSDGFNAYNKDSIVTKGHNAEKSPSPNGTMPKGNYAPSLKGTMHSAEREPSITDTTTENTIDTFSDAKASAPVSSKKAVKAKKELSPIDAEIRDRVKDFVDRFTKWHLKTIGRPYLTNKLDFINLTSTFKKLNESGGYSPEKTFAELASIVLNYNKLKDFSKSQISVNYIATKWSVLLTEIQNHKEPAAQLAKTYTSEPVQAVRQPAPKNNWNEYPLPYGINRQQFVTLATQIAEGLIMDGVLDEEYNTYDYCLILWRQIRNYTIEQVQLLLTENEIQ